MKCGNIKSELLFAKKLQTGTLGTLLIIVTIKSAYDNVWACRGVFAG
jgi:hypothetical protein